MCIASYIKMTQEKIHENNILTCQQNGVGADVGNNYHKQQDREGKSVFSSKKCRRKPIKNGISSYNKYYDKKQTINSRDVKIDTNNNERSTTSSKCRGGLLSSIQKLKEAKATAKPTIQLTTEVIDIEQECVRAQQSAFPSERCGTKRKKASIDQLLSKVEAKHSKLEETMKIMKQKSSTSSSSSGSRRRSSGLNTSSESSSFAAKESKVHHVSENHVTNEQYPKMAYMSSSATDNRIQCNNSVTTTTTVKQTHTKKTKNHQTNNKPNKRTLSTNERYSKLTSTQLQRRLVANARERSRVHALSNAFDALRCTIPSYSTEQKLSKLTILRVAINYINALDQLLSPNPSIDGKKPFEKYVDECTAVLQTEYGRSKK